MKMQIFKFRWVFAAASLLALLAAGLIAFANHACQLATRGRIFVSVETVPQNDVALVLGMARETRHGQPNLHFDHRIQAAAALYRSGKVRHLLVSGDNHVAGYDEPSDMRSALVAVGVPPGAITRDYAGFRTLDSVMRAKTVFGLQHFTIVTEEFHCPRALWIARQHGLDAVAFAAPDVKRTGWALRANAREQLALAWCAMDLYVLHRTPKFAGPPEPIVLTLRNQ